MKIQLTYSILIIFLNPIDLVCQKINNPNFYIKGQIIGDYDSVLVLRYLQNKTKLIADTTYVKNGFFSFKGIIEEPQVVALIGKRKKLNISDPRFTLLFIDKGTTRLTVNALDFKDYKLQGSKNQHKYYHISKLIEDSLKNNVYLKKEKNKIVYEILVSFVKKNHATFSSLQIISDYSELLNHEQLSYLFSLLNKQLTRTGLGNKLFLKLQNEKYLYDAEIIKKITVSNINNEIVILDSVAKGAKYILLNFWATWCEPCIKKIPELQNLAKKYENSGLKIVNISIDHNKNQWLNGISKYGINNFENYHSYVNLNGNIQDIISEKFNINEIPTAYLLDNNKLLIKKIDISDSLSDILRYILDLKNRL